jgi:hypothetical protein
VVACYSFSGRVRSSSFLWISNKRLRHKVVVFELVEVSPAHCSILLIVQSLHSALLHKKGAEENGGPSPQHTQTNNGCQKQSNTPKGKTLADKIGGSRGMHIRPFDALPRVQLVAFVGFGYRGSGIKLHFYFRSKTIQVNFISQQGNLPSWSCSSRPSAGWLPQKPWLESSGKRDESNLNVHQLLT